MEAAGGIGGLLAVCDPNDPCDPADTAGEFVYTYDANGNVGQLIDGTPTSWDAGTVMVARYEYDPYGKGTQSAGSYAAANPFRFSTKWFDDETGFGYWGERYYWPELGRWLNRDPIEEAGGVNLYGYVGNEPISGLDAHGENVWLENTKHLGGWHMRICVTTRDSECQPTGKACFTFYDSNVEWWNDGEVREETPEADDGDVHSVPALLQTTCNQDKNILRYLRAMVDRRANYWIPGNTCRSWSQDHFRFIRDRLWGFNGPAGIRALIGGTWDYVAPPREVEYWDFYYAWHPYPWWNNAACPSRLPRTPL